MLWQRTDMYVRPKTSMCGYVLTRRMHKESYKLFPISVHR